MATMPAKRARPTGIGDRSPRRSPAAADGSSHAARPATDPPRSGSRPSRRREQSGGILATARTLAAAQYRSSAWDRVSGWLRARLGRPRRLALLALPPMACTEDVLDPELIERIGMSMIDAVGFSSGNQPSSPHRRDQQALHGLDHWPLAPAIPGELILGGPVGPRSETHLRDPAAPYSTTFAIFMNRRGRPRLGRPAAAGPTQETESQDRQSLRSLIAPGASWLGPDVQFSTLQLVAPLS